MGIQHSKPPSRQEKHIILTTSAIDDGSTVALNSNFMLNTTTAPTITLTTNPRVTSNSKCKQSENISLNGTTYNNQHHNWGKRISAWKELTSKSAKDCIDSTMNKVTSYPKTNDEHKPIIMAGSTIIPSSQNICSRVEKFAKCLVKYTGGVDMISKEMFQTYVFPKSQIASEYLWDFFKDYTDVQAISEEMFLRSADKIYAQITDKEQIHFYVKVFGKGNESVERNSFHHFLQSAYQLSPIIGTDASIGTNNLEDDLQDGRKWMESVGKSCFHIKEEMSVFFLSNWVFNNLPRVLMQMHKCILHQVTAGYQIIKPKNGEISDSNESNLKEESDRLFPGVNPILLWLLSCSLPDKYMSNLKDKPQQTNGHTKILNSKQLLEMVNNKQDNKRWIMLYNSDEHGTSINRFQHHVFNYRGTNLMFITADNGYQLCLGSDSEWKESCHFWGGEDSIIIQLQPEFRIVERGEKIVYCNFSIRGYPFGIQAGKDPRNVSVDVKPDFQYVSFKKMPCKIEKLVVYGCGLPEAKSAQTDYKKWEAKESQKQKIINLNSKEWNDNPDKYLLELAGNYKSYGNN